MVLAEFLPGSLQVQAHVEPVPAAVGVHLVVPPGGRVQHDPFPVGQPEPVPDPRGHVRRVGPAQQVVARVAVLADLPVVPERAAHDRGAERVRREQQVPLRDVPGQVVEVRRPADELRVGDVEADPLQRRAVPGLQVDLAVALAERGLHVVVGDQVPRPGQRLVVLLGAAEHPGAALGHRHRPVGDRPQVLAVIAPAAQFLRDAERVVPALLALPADEEDRVAHRGAAEHRGIEAAPQRPLAEVALLDAAQLRLGGDQRIVVAGDHQPVPLAPGRDPLAGDIAQPVAVVLELGQRLGPRSRPPGGRRGSIRRPAAGWPSRRTASGPGRSRC